MPRTAGTGRPDPTKVTWRSRIDRTGSAIRPGLLPGGPSLTRRTAIVRAISMLSMSSVKPDRFFAATIRPWS